MSKSSENYNMTVFQTLSNIWSFQKSDKTKTTLNRLDQLSKTNFNVLMHRTKFFITLLSINEIKFIDNFLSNIPNDEILLVFGPKNNATSLLAMLEKPNASSWKKIVIENKDKPHILIKETTENKRIYALYQQWNQKIQDSISPLSESKLDNGQDKLINDEEENEKLVNQCIAFWVHKDELEYQIKKSDQKSEILIWSMSDSDNDSLISAWTTGILFFLGEHDCPIPDCHVQKHVIDEEGFRKWKEGVRWRYMKENDKGPKLFEKVVEKVENKDNIKMVYLNYKNGNPYDFSLCDVIKFIVFIIFLLVLAAIGIALFVVPLINAIVQLVVAGKISKLQDEILKASVKGDFTELSQWNKCLSTETSDVKPVVWLHWLGMSNLIVYFLFLIIVAAKTANAKLGMSIASVANCCFSTFILIWKIIGIILVVKMDESCVADVTRKLVRFYIYCLLDLLLWGMWGKCLVPIVIGTFKGLRKYYS